MEFKKYLYLVKDDDLDCVTKSASEADDKSVSADDSFITADSFNESYDTKHVVDETGDASTADEGLDERSDIKPVVSDNGKAIATKHSNGDTRVTNDNKHGHDSEETGASRGTDEYKAHSNYEIKNNIKVEIKSEKVKNETTRDSIKQTDEIDDTSTEGDKVDGTREEGDRVDGKKQHFNEGVPGSKTGQESGKDLKRCNFCKEAASVVCRFCSYRYCKCCRDKFHPPIGPYEHHDVIDIAEDDTMEQYELCVEHGLPEQLSCDFCKSKKCVECARTKCKLHFKGRISNVDIETEKKKLFAEYENASSKLSFLNKYRENIEEEALNIELKTMLKKEKIRQEFVSFHEMLITKEQAILEKLEADMEARLEHLNGTLLSRIKKLEQEDSRLTDVVMDVIQSKDDLHFLENHVKARDRCHDIDKHIKEFDDFWAKNCSYPPSYLLDFQFSMIREKCQLSQSLGVVLENVGVLRFRQSTLQQPIEPYIGFDIFKYINIPPAPPSTELQYLVQVSQEGVNLYSEMVSDLKNFWLNSVVTCEFNPFTTYLVKVTLYLRTLYPAGQQHCIKQSGVPTHMLIYNIPKKEEFKVKINGKVVKKGVKEARKVLRKD